MTTPLCQAGLRLVATRTAITCAGLFVVSTLMKWGVRTILRSAVGETEALVIAAVNATGIPPERMYWTELTRAPEYITIRLYGLEKSVRIEVWDSAPNPPLLPEGTESPVKRGYYPTPRGKVVWVDVGQIAELPRVEVVAKTTREIGGLSGFSEYTKGRWYIVINSDDHITRRRFTLCHEFKHVLDHPFIGTLYPDAKGKPSSERAERICDYFSACLIMPRMWVKRA